MTITTIPPFVFSPFSYPLRILTHPQNTFRALFRTFTQCCFIEDDGDIVFYKNKDGKASRVLAPGALDLPVKKNI
jgi:hypothetical protein